MLRRHPLLISACLLLIAFATALTLFIATFDLNSYRNVITNRLSTQLGVPVSIEDAHFALHQGINLEFSDVRIGDASCDYSIRADNLSLRLKIWPLLDRQLSFSAIEIVAPDVNLHKAPARLDFQEIVPAHTLQELLEETQLHSLHISDGRFRWQTEGADDSDSSLPFFSDIDLELSDVRPNATAALRLSAGMHFGSSAVSQLEAKVEATPAADWSQWMRWEIASEIEVRNLDPKLFGDELPYAPQLEGKGDLKFSAQGSLHQGFDLRARLEGLRATAAESAASANFTIETAGRAAPEDRSWALILSSARINDLHLQGALTLKHEEKNSDSGLRVQGEISSEPLPADKLRALLSLLDNKDLLGILPAAGELTLEKLHLEGTAHMADPAGYDPQGLLTYAALQGKNLSWETPAGQVKEAELRLVYENAQLRISQGQLVWHEIPWVLSGQIEDLFSAGRSQLDLTAEADTTIDQLMSLATIDIPEILKVQGPLVTSLHLTGDPTAPEFFSRTDLSRVKGRWGKLAQKPAGMPTTLSLRGALQQDQLSLQSSELKLGDLRIQSTGKMDLSAPHSFRLIAQLDQFDLSQLQQFLPSVEEFKLQGLVQGEVLLSGTQNELDPPLGEFILNNGGAHFFNIVADLNHTQGEIKLSGSSVKAARLTARLGESRFQVAAQIADLNSPRLVIDFDGRDLRPRDLVFRGGEKNLESIRGQLEIDGDGIFFTPVHAHTGGGTRAVVSGAVHGYSRPHIELSIDAEHGNIDEILDFFSGPERKQEEEQQETGRTTMHIDVKTDSGTFHTLEFAQAEAEIYYQGGVLQIYPLHADLDPGYYVGRIVWTKPPGRHAHLKVSGHLENIDAEEAQRTQSDMPGLITGTLRGDFYLEGETGEFIATSQGGFSLEAQEGVLRRFQVLSKVFSLLNVAQILSFQLPDMAREGMPYNRINANFSLRNGILASDDLLVDSNAINLSMVGEINLSDDTIDAVLGVKPLKTVDTVISKIPIAGWILTGEDKSLVMTHFRVEGDLGDPQVEPIPITSISKKVRGVFQRVLGYPGKIFSEFEEAGQSQQQSP